QDQGQKACTRRNHGQDARATRRGAALLEVVIAISVLALAMGVIGATFYNSDANVHHAIDKSRAMMLTEQFITNYDTGQFQQGQGGEAAREGSGMFGDAAPPGWAWAYKVEKDLNVPGLERVTVRIVQKDPEGKSDEESPILVSHFLRAEKKNLNLQEDLG